MGYACPVCATPQRDGEHLAHHLAFTAMIHGDDHEAWLDAHAPDWGEQDPEGLASAVVDHAAETEYAEVFDDTVDRGRPDVGGHAGHDHGGHAGHDHGGTRAPVDDDAATGIDPDAAAAIREARALTREMYADGDDGSDDPNGDDGSDDRDEDGSDDRDGDDART
ncbi:DUF5810 domain-containing protein [Halorubrum sp. DTA98]|uniref:DUF5810 domain-containing protein n=1 Tax=Halorubrum sp. DTA98 TaxID=3402163 RepID=UPI003AACF873